MRLFLLIAFVWPAVPTASGQLLAARDAEIAMGHHHLNVADVEAEKKFWTKGLGATTMRLGAHLIVRFPDALIFLHEQEPTGGTKGSSVDHIGVAVPDVDVLVAKLRSMGYPIATRLEISGGRANSDVFRSPTQDIDLAFTFSPGGVKLELVEQEGQQEPVRNHHAHLAGPDPGAMMEWYVKTFGARPGVRGSFQEARLPGVRVTFIEKDAPLAGTRGRALDHIGFEVDGLETFVQKLENQGVKFDVPYRKLLSLGIAVAFLTDPWGTYIELTEGLDEID